MPLSKQWIADLLGASACYPAEQLSERRRVSKRLARIRKLRERGLMTWDDYEEEHRLQRRLVDLDLAAEEA